MIIFGKKGAETIGRSQKEIMEKLFNESEEYLIKTLCQAIGASVTEFPDALEEEQVKLMNDALAYWQTSKQLALASAELSDKQFADISANLEEIKEEQKKNRKLLEELSRRGN